jgi:phosphinothricin acetyltransferase
MSDTARALGEAGTVPASAPRVVIRATEDRDLDAMMAIYRQHVQRGIEPGVFDEEDLLQTEDLKRRRKNLKAKRLPHLAAEIDGVIVGYAYAVPFRKRPAYRFALKHSIYVHRDHVRAGIGRILLPALVDACAVAGFRQMIGYIDAGNEASLRLHAKFGFREVGRLPSIGFKFGKWSDTVMVQRALGPGDGTLPDVW